MRGRTLVISHCFKRKEGYKKRKMRGKRGAMERQVRRTREGRKEVKRTSDLVRQTVIT